MKNKTIAILENRIGEQLAELVKKYGGIPFPAPALAEIPDIDPVHITAQLGEWETSPPSVFIFQTGVGVKALFATTDALGLTEKLLSFLESATVVVRGTKSSAVLHARKVRQDLVAKEPHTTKETLIELDTLAINGKHVVVQKYGDTNWELQTALEEKGAKVTNIATYRWGLPADIAPLIALMDALERNAIDVTAFTSSSQVTNLFTVAQQMGKREALVQGLNRSLIASIGPVCTAALNEAGVRVDIEPTPPKLGPFIAAINSKLDVSNTEA